MNIGIAADLTKLPPKTIRYYEEIELITPERAENGYRKYSEIDVYRLRFLERARSLGFSIEECRLLLSLYDDDNRASSDVKAISQIKIEEINHKIRKLKSLKATLVNLAEHCHGDERPDCPILDDLSGRTAK